VIRVKEGSTVEVTVHNKRKEAHGFEVTEISGSQLTIAAGSSAKVSFPVPHAGTYIYHDGQAGPLFRILGLHGVLVVEPSDGRTPSGSQTPYSSSDLTPAIAALFDALGTDARFPGAKWIPAPSNAEFSNQEKIWVFADVDPKFNALLRPGSPISTSSPLVTNVVGNFVPRYFTINGRSGFDASRGADIIPSNFAGEPTLIRNVNAGLCTHSPHIHGNDVFLLTTGQPDPTATDFGRVKVASNILAVDVWSTTPLLREDVLLPFERPTDIPQGQFERIVAGKAQEPLPLRYVMHCHTEMSQTAGGGNYPQGLVTHWEIVGGLGGRPKPNGALAAR
jgi:FtsP/CotA-like multicopper oxidase with cupredoxin domain